MPKSEDKLGEQQKYFKKWRQLINRESEETVTILKGVGAEGRKHVYLSTLVFHHMCGVSSQDEDLHDRIHIPEVD